jgi:hypothetical protein
MLNIECPHPSVRVLDASDLVFDGPWKTDESVPFWKTRLLNLGIKESAGAILTFLDADAIVGPRFMEGQRVLYDLPDLTKACYRVQRLVADDWRDLREHPQTHLDVLRARWPSRSVERICYEAYGTPDNHMGTGEPHGNSQFSITREKLGDLRFDERYIGRGFDDLSMNRDLWRRYGESYRGYIWKDADHAMFHISHPYSPGFSADRWNQRNAELYRSEA